MSPSNLCPSKGWICIGGMMKASGAAHLSLWLEYILKVDDSFSWRSDYKCLCSLRKREHFWKKKLIFFRYFLAAKRAWAKAFSLTIWSCDIHLDVFGEKKSKTNKHSSSMRRSCRAHLDRKLWEKGMPSESRHNWDIICNWAVNTWVIPSKPETPCGSVTQKWRHL